MYCYLITVRFQAGPMYALISLWGEIEVRPGDSRTRILDHLIERARAGCLKSAPWAGDSDVVVLQFTLEPDLI